MQIRYITFTRTPAGTYIKAETPKQHSRAARNAQRRAAAQEHIGAIVAALDFFAMLGSAGSADCGTMPLGVCLVWSLAGLAALALGLYMAHAFYGQEAAAKWNK